MRNIGPVMVPPGGTLVYDKNNEHVEGFTREILIEQLTTLRQANSVRIGDPERDVDEFLSGVEGYSSPIPMNALQERPRRTKIRLIDRVNSWLATRYSKLSTIRYVNATEAQRRAAICIKCPKNADWRSSCSHCSAESKNEIERNVIIISQNKKTPFNHLLKACSVAGHENRAAVVLEEEFLKHRVNFAEKLPERCWLRSL